MGGYSYALACVAAALSSPEDTAAASDPLPDTAVADLGDADNNKGAPSAGLCVVGCGDKSMRVLALRAGAAWASYQGSMVWQGVQGQVTSLAVMPSALQRMGRWWLSFFHGVCFCFSPVVVLLNCVVHCGEGFLPSGFLVVWHYSVCMSLVSIAYHSLRICWFVISLTSLESSAVHTPNFNQDCSRLAVTAGMWGFWTLPHSKP